MSVDEQRVYRSGQFSISGGERRPLRMGYDATLDGHAVVYKLARALPPEAADLMEVAAMAYAVDRIAPRPKDRLTLDGSGWGRRLWMQVPVRDPRLWNSVAERLVGLLGWLTDDHWELTFCQLAGDSGPLDELQGFLFDTVPGGSSPALFSGGLDSAIGLAHDLQEGCSIAISVHTNYRMQSVQRRVVRGLATDPARVPVHLQYRVSLHERDRENSQRTRGLLFLAAGIAAAWGLGQDRLRVFENGIGAINLPYLRSQYGPQATRSMHPRTLRLTEGLASAVSGRPFRMEAPFLRRTKAEALSAVPELQSSTIADTVSCDTGFSARVAGSIQCGACTSCVLRRLALHAAGRADADTTTSYRDRSPAAKESVKAMAWQVERLRDSLGKPDPWQGLVSEFPPILDAGPLTPSEVIRLYRAYVREWDAVEHIFGLRPHDRSAA
jgi:7-cyano-7-deazaguanine synthase in queuosine biosynthesis